MVLFYLITVVVSYLFLREGIKRQENRTSELGFEEIVILIVMVLVPVINLISSFGLYFDLLKGKNDAQTLLERFFLIKK